MEALPLGTDVAGYVMDVLIEGKDATEEVPAMKSQKSLRRTTRFYGLARIVSFQDDRYVHACAPRYCSVTVSEKTAQQTRELSTP